MNRRERAERLEGTIARAIADLEQSMAAGQSEDLLKALSWWSKFRTYSFNNSILILMQRPDAIQVAGYRRWEQLGYQVAKGEKCIWIRGPVFKKVPDEDTGELKERLVGYIPLCVFDIQQTVEWPEKQPPQLFTPASAADWEHLYEVWRRRLATLYGIEVKEVDLGSLTYGVATRQTIRINGRFEAGIKAPVLLHELSHIVAGHTARQGKTKWSLQERELQVEASTFVLSQMVGGSHPHSAQYLLHYRIEAGMLADHLEMIGRIVRDVRHMLDFDHLGRQEQEAA